MGGLDGVDVWGFNIWIHDVEVTSEFCLFLFPCLHPNLSLSWHPNFLDLTISTVTDKDECVTVKNPSNHLLIENIYCNWSGGVNYCLLLALTAATCMHSMYSLPEVFKRYRLTSASNYLVLHWVSC